MSGADASEPSAAERALATLVAVDRRYVPFGELNSDQVADRAAELADAVGLGHAGPLAGVAAAWKELAALMRGAGAATVAELEPDELGDLPERLWVTGSPSRAFGT